MSAMADPVRLHYERYPYPRFSLLASVRRCDTYALNLESLWARCNGELLQPGEGRILLAGCGSFSPYPTSLANPHREIVALDLSRRNLGRARLHALMHGCRNVRYAQGSLLNPAAVTGTFHFIDAFGVIHHLDDPLAGLQALTEWLVPGGILRLMVYSRGARREAEAIRRAFRLLGVRDVAAARRLIRRAPAESRLATFVRCAPELRSASGLADALLHPQARTYRIDELLEMVAAAQLTPVLFAHPGALPDIAAEVARLQTLERQQELDNNFVLYLARAPRGSCGLDPGTSVFLNPALRGVVSRFLPPPRRIPPKLGTTNPVLDALARRLLRGFVQPVPVAALDSPTRERLQPFLSSLFLTAVRS